MSPRKSLTFAVAIAIVAAIFTTPTASAADYRYWTFWTSGPVVQCSVAEGASEPKCEELPAANDWQFAQVGAQDIQLRDKSVTAWKFAVSTPDGSEAPGEPADFAALCPDMSNPVSDQFRVAVVIDFGSTAIAPSGDTPPTPNKVECVSVEVGQNAADALVLATSDIRADGGFVCGIDGYPSTECGTEVDAAALATNAETEPAAGTEAEAIVAETVAAEPATDALPGWLWPLVGVAVVALLIVIVIGARRGRKA